MSEKFISYDNLKQYDEFLDKELQDIKQHVDEGFTFNVKYAESSEIGGAALKAISDENGENIAEHFNNIENDVAINKSTLGYTKKNLFPINTKSMSANGWVMGGGTDIYKLYIPKGEYIFSFKQTGTGQSEINFYDSTNTQITRILPYVSTANTLMTYKITLSSDCYGVKFYNSSGENTYSEIMMRSADITDDTYEPYVESVDERLQNFVKSGSGAKSGLVPAPPTTAGTTKYLREDGTWQVPPYLPVRSGYGLSQGLYSATTGTIGYVLLCTIKITGTYQNTPTTIVYTQRGDSEAVYLSVSFASTNNTDPALNKFTYFGPSYVRAYIVKSTTSTWQIYIQKTESYDSISLLYYAKPYHSEQTTITWNNTQVTTLPTGYVKATRGGNVAYADKATYDKNGKDISTTYLPLAGGTMDDDVNIKFSRTSDDRYYNLGYKGISFAAPSTATWSAGINLYKNDGSTLMGALGAHGTGEAISNYFIGSSYSDPLFKLDTSGNGTFKGSVTATSFSGNASSATKLATARTIDGVSFNGSANITHYGTCSTAAGTKAKDVVLSGFSLVTGARINVNFSNTNSADNITLNVNGTGAIPVFYVNSQMTARTLKLQGKHVYGFVYDGTNWIYEGDSSYSSQNTTTTNADYRVLLSHTDDDITERGVTRKSSKFTANPSTGVLTATTFSGNATSASKLSNTTAIGSATNPVYFNASGVPVACTYSLNKTVPSNAVFTDTNTKVTQTLTSGTGKYPLLLTPSGQTATTTTTACFAKDITLQPSTGILTATSFKSSGVNLIASGSVKILSASGMLPQTTTIEPEGFNGSHYSSLVLSIFNTFGGVISAVLPMNYLLSGSNSVYIPVHLYNNYDEMGMFRPMHMKVTATSTGITIETPYDGSTYWTETYNNYSYKLFKI